MISGLHLEIIRSHLLSFTEPFNVFEWGCGNSTIELTQWPTSYFVWVCAETSPMWANLVVQRTFGIRRGTLHVQLFNYGTDIQDNLKKLPMDDYVTYPKRAAPDFDVFIVDGRKRARCIKLARTMLRPGGVIYLHDASREYYHEACQGLAITEYKDWAGDLLWAMRAK